MQSTCASVSIRTTVRLAGVDPNGWRVLEAGDTAEFWCSCGQAALGQRHAVQQMAEPHLRRAGALPPSS